MSKPETATLTSILEVDLVCADYAEKLRLLEAGAQDIERATEPLETQLRAQDLFAELAEISHLQARRLADLRQNLDTGNVATQVQQTSLHQDYLLRSAFIRRALEKPRGYAGDMELMLMICGGEDPGPDLFSRAVNQVYLQLPASEAVRQRVAFLSRVLDEVPADSSVLNVACGPALEVQRSQGATRARIDLLDHDPETIDFLLSSGVADGTRVRALRGNAFRIMSGDYRVRHHVPAGDAEDEVLSAQYDLIYSAGLFDYIPTGDGLRLGARPLTRRLYDLLRPGGRLLVGNYLDCNPKNPHLEHHRAMMELYSEWTLLYRSIEEIEGFAESLPPGEFSATLVNERGEPIDTATQSTIGFLEIRRRP